MTALSEDVFQTPYISSHISGIIRQFADESRQLLNEHIIAEYLFGSYAMNTHTALSDIDILIIVDKLTPEIRWQMSGLASEYSLEYDIYISPVIKEQQIWKSNQQYDTLFYQEVKRHGIPL